MLKSSILLILAALGVFIVDQNIKWIFVEGFRYYTECIDLILVYNRGVAFSMFAFLEEGLKWIQIALLVGVIGYTLWLKKNCYILPVGIMVGAGFSNVYDRFIHGFNFAVFNLADVMIDVAVIWLLILNFRPQSCKS